MCRCVPMHAWPRHTTHSAQACWRPLHYGRIYKVAQKMLTIFKLNNKSFSPESASARQALDAGSQLEQLASRQVEHIAYQPISMFLDMTDDGFDLLHRLPTADESQFSSKLLSSSIDGVGRCPLPLISKRVLFSPHFQTHVRARNFS